MGREDPQLKLRLTEDMKTAVTEAAKHNNRSVNAEIVQRLEKSFADPTDLPEELIDRIRRKGREVKIPVRSLIISALEDAFPFGYSVGSFIDLWAVPISKIPSLEKRREKIDEANEDPKSKASGLYLREYEINDEVKLLAVHQSYMSGRDEAVASLYVDTPTRGER